MVPQHKMRKQRSFERLHARVVPEPGEQRGRQRHANRQDQCGEDQRKVEPLPQHGADALMLASTFVLTHEHVGVADRAQRERRKVPMQNAGRQHGGDRLDRVPARRCDR